MEVVSSHIPQAELQEEVSNRPPSSIDDSPTAVHVYLYVHLYVHVYVYWEYVYVYVRRCERAAAADT